MTAPMCENCKNFREFRELDLVDDFMQKWFNGYCYSENKEHGKGKPHTKADWCKDFDAKCDMINCKNTPRWKVGFSFMVHDAFMFECSGKNEFQESLCDKHFIELNGCGNAVEFRQIEEEKWNDFNDFDNPFILRDLVKKSYKIYITGHFKKLDIFL